MGGSRWRIETQFETGKSDVGLDEYETRTWAGWHHHITMCLLAGAYLLTLQQDWGKKMPQITRPQVYRVVRELLPKEKFGPRELLLWLADVQERNGRARRPMRNAALLVVAMLPAFLPGQHGAVAGDAPPDRLRPRLKRLDALSAPLLHTPPRGPDLTVAIFSVPTQPDYNFLYDRVLLHFGHRKRGPFFEPKAAPDGPAQL